MGPKKLIELTGFSRSVVYAVLGGARPRADHRVVYERVAASGQL
jgi:hypothetical protein